MTTRGKVQIFNCSDDEGFHQGHAADAIPSSCRQSLFLEWYSQNGHIIVELLEVAVRRVHIPLIPLPDETDPWDPLDAGDEILDDQVEDEDDEFAEEDESEEEDPFGLFPEDLEDRLACGLSPEEGELDPFSDEELDALSDDPSTEIPLRMLFDPPLKLYPACQLTDSQLEESLQVLLACLARHGVALRVCEHFTAHKLIAYCSIGSFQKARFPPPWSIPAACSTTRRTISARLASTRSNTIDQFQHGQWEVVPGSDSPSIGACGSPPQETGRPVPMELDRCGTRLGRTRISTPERLPPQVPFCLLDPMFLAPGSSRREQSPRCQILVPKEPEI